MKPVSNSNCSERDTCDDGASSSRSANNNGMDYFNMNTHDAINIHKISSRSSRQTIEVLRRYPYRSDSMSSQGENPLVGLNDTTVEKKPNREKGMIDIAQVLPLFDRTVQQNGLDSCKSKTNLESKTSGDDNDNAVTIDATMSSSAQNSCSSETKTASTAIQTTGSSGSGGDEDDKLLSHIGLTNEKKDPRKIKNIDRRNSNCNDSVLCKQGWDDGALTSRIGGLHRSGNLPFSEPVNDCSSLHVPRDNGSHRLAVGSEEGTVPTKPATVVASRLYAPASNPQPFSMSVGREGGGGYNLLKAQTQHSLLLPPHREPGYHTIKKTLYRYQNNIGNKSNSGSSKNNRSKRKRHRKSNDNKMDATSANENTEETARMDARSNHLHPNCCNDYDCKDRNIGNSESTHKSKHKHNKKKIRSDKKKTGGNMPVEEKTTYSQMNDSSLTKERNEGSNSSGSGTDGTEDGYAGSVSSNETGARNQIGSTSPSPSSTSSEECEQTDGCKGKSNRESSLGAQDGRDLFSSSEIADFSSSGNSETMDEEDVPISRHDERERRRFDMKTYPSSSPSPSPSSSICGDSDGLELSYLSAKRVADAEHDRMINNFTQDTKSKTLPRSRDESISCIMQKNYNKRQAVKNIDDGRPPILTLGCDVMAHVLTFLQPPDILDVLTWPLSKLWRVSFTSQSELWRVLCLVEPFKATVNDYVYTSKSSGAEKRLLDKYRLLYTSFVRCMKYISQIRDDALNGRPPAYIDYGLSGTARTETINSHSLENATTTDDRSSPPPPSIVGSNKNFQMFLAQARDVVKSTNNHSNGYGETKHDEVVSGRKKILPSLATAARVGTVISKTNRGIEKNEKKNQLKFGRSMITSRLFGPTPEGEPGNMNLPWSCAIYSIVNWMVAFSDVEGIQTLCLKALPVLLENEQHRLTAQSAGLADVVLRAMVTFTESAELHIAAFHTLVILARPHGGKEGMLFHCSMTADGIFGGKNQQHGKSGIAVMLDSMKRFQDNDALLAMSCWALVNIALVSDQKAVLVKLGGIQAITNAMSRHPFSAELQFRALFALINLVIPSVDKTGNVNENVNGGNVIVASSRQTIRGGTAGVVQDQLGDLNETTEKEIIDELVSDISGNVVRVMKNFCSNEAIINRACLVLHNLSLTEEYHATLLWTPHCYQMLQWCVINYKTDQVLQQSATGTLHRLQSTLSRNDEMREAYTESLRTQQQIE